jgi:hypothetical protein
MNSITAAFAGVPLREAAMTVLVAVAAATLPTPAAGKSSLIIFLEIPYPIWDC